MRQAHPRDEDFDDGLVAGIALVSVAAAIGFLLGMLLPKVI